MEGGVEDGMRKLEGELYDIPLCLLTMQWLIPLSSRYLILVLYNVQAYIKMLFRVAC